MQKKYSNTNCHCKILSLNHNFVKLEGGHIVVKAAYWVSPAPQPKKNLLPSTMKMMSTNCANSFSPTEKIVSQDYCQSTRNVLKLSIMPNFFA